MNKVIKILFREFYEFVGRQYFVIILILTLGLKLSYFSSLVGINYPFDHMFSGYVFSFFTATLLLYPLIFVKHKKPLALGINIFISIILLLDLIYYRFFQSLPTFGLLSAINQTRDIAWSATTLFSWGDLQLFADVIGIMILDSYLKKRNYLSLKINKNRTIEKAFGILLLLALVSLTLSFRYENNRRDKLAEAINQTLETRANIKYFGIIGSHLIDGYRYALEKFTIIDSETKAPVVVWARDNLLKQPANNDLTGTAKGKRVILLQVESLANFPINNKVKNQEITPNLNAFMVGSNYFSDNRFFIGAGHTSDTDFVVNCSIYPLNDSSVLVRYGQNEYTGLARVMRENSYDTTAYHGYNRSFWNRSVAFVSLGYQKFLAAESYPRGVTYNISGLNDRDFLHETAEYIKDSPENSLHYIITLSSHHPFKMGREGNSLDLDGLNIPRVAGDYLQSINYTDRAIGEFLENLKAKGLYDDSLIIVYGDHNAPSVESFSIGDFKYDAAGTDALRVPLMIKTPSQREGVIHNSTTTLLDVAPTILDLLGLRANIPMFGQSLFARGGSVLPRCTNGEVIHNPNATDCDAEVIREKEIATKMIKYNIFDSF